MAYKRSDTPSNFPPMGDNDGIRISGFADFVTRSKLMSSLVDGALVELHETNPVNSG